MMKKILYGTTALIVGTLMGGQAMAAGTPMTSNNFNLTLGGNLNFNLRWEQQDPRQNNVATDGTLWAVIYAVNPTGAPIAGIPALAGGVPGHGYATSYTASSSLIYLSRTFSVATTAPTNGVAVNAADVANAGLAAGNHYRNNDFELTGMISIEGTSPKFPNGTTAGFYVGLNIAGAELLNAQGKNATGSDRQTNTNGMWGSGGPSCSITDAAPASACGVNRSNFVGDNYVWLDGRWGKIYLGGQANNAAAALQVGLTRTYSAVNALLLSDPDATPALNPAGQNRITSSGFQNTVNSTSENNRAVWMLPAMSGMRVGLVYNPDNTMQNTTGPTPDNYNGSSKATTEAYLQWAGTVSGLASRIAAGYATTSAGDTRGNALTGGITQNSNYVGFQNTGIDIKSDAVWTIGGDVKTGPILLSAFTRRGTTGGPSVNPSENTIRNGIAGTYTTGVWTFGASMTKSSQEAADRRPGANFGGILGTDRGRQADVGLEYRGLGTGKTLTFGYRQEVYTAGGDGIHTLASTCSAGGGQPADAALCSNQNTRSYDLKYALAVGPGVTETIGVQHMTYLKHTGLDPLPAEKTGTGALITTALRF